MIHAKQLRSFTEQIFQAIGCSESDAKLAADVLISADLRGVDSHGVARLAGYVRLYDNGRLNPTPAIRVVHQTPSTAVVDGDRGLGLVVGPWAMQLAIEKARVAGTGWVAVRNSNHFGIAGYHALLAAEHDMIGQAMTHAAPLVAPTFSLDKLLGTNPIAVAIPAQTEPTFVADFASTAVAYGKLEILQREGQAIPTGWAQDTAGNPTTDANAVKNGGALLPLGSDREHGSHKGYGLGAIVDIFSGVLSGANYGPWVPPFAQPVSCRPTRALVRVPGIFSGPCASTRSAPPTNLNSIWIPGFSGFGRLKRLRVNRFWCPATPNVWLKLSG